MWNHLKHFQHCIHDISSPLASSTLQFTLSHLSYLSSIWLLSLFSFYRDISLISLSMSFMVCGWFVICFFFLLVAWFRLFSFIMPWIQFVCSQCWETVKLFPMNIVMVTFVVWCRYFSTTVENWNVSLFCFWLKMKFWAMILFPYFFLIYWWLARFSESLVLASTCL